MGRLACWACWDRRPLGLDFGTSRTSELTLTRHASDRLGIPRSMKFRQFKMASGVRNLNCA
eukprot:3102711-Alexandrium_andersonii.AAC.1